MAHIPLYMYPQNIPMQKTAQAGSLLTSPLLPLAAGAAAGLIGLLDSSDDSLANRILKTLLLGVGAGGLTAGGQYLLRKAFMPEYPLPMPPELPPQPKEYTPLTIHDFSPEDLPSYFTPIPEVATIRAPSRITFWKWT